VNIAGSLILFPILGHVGIAIATSLSGWTNALQLAFTLMRRGHFRFDASLARRAPLLVLASALMGAALYAANLGLARFFEDGTGPAMHVAALGALVSAGVVAYAAATLMTGAMRLSMLRRAASRG
jgi:putative peptidoglycan lipid II flippase